MQIQDGMLRKVIEGVSNTYGDDFFNAICLQLAELIGADYVFIALLDRVAFESSTIALVVKGQIQPNMTYSLAHTPCADVSNNSICCYPCNVTELYPQDQLLIDLKIQAYLGTPLRNSQGLVTGLIVAMHEQSLAEPDLILTLFEVFSGRISAEIERKQHEQALKDLNQQLESKVQQRTAELQSTLENLQTAQTQLVEAEKMAALGNLVAGVAHEVNTPLGVSITAQSYMTNAVSMLAKSVASHQLTEEQMTEFLAVMDTSLSLQERNLTRARDLIENFKRTAADQHSHELDRINLKNYYEQIFSTLHPLLKSANVQLQLDIDPRLEALTYPGCHAQIITNLVTNSIQHGFGQTNDGHQIKLVIVQGENGLFNVRYQDNGVGLTEDARRRIFEPFYTTSRHTGGTGLGMSILYNLVTQRLEGSVQIDDSSKGFALVYSFKANLH